MNSKVFSSYCDSMVVILITNTIRANSSFKFPFTTPLLVLNNS